MSRPRKISVVFDLTSLSDQQAEIALRAAKLGETCHLGKISAVSIVEGPLTAADKGDIDDQVYPLSRCF